MNSTPKPSGPLWAECDKDGNVSCYKITEHKSVASLMTNARKGVHPTEARLIPGHGKVVPLELVETIKQAFEELYVDQDTAYDDYCGEPQIVGLKALRDAIRAAIEGAL